MTSSEIKNNMEQCCLCGSRGFVGVLSLPQYTYVRCLQCGLVRRYQGLSPNTQEQLYDEKYFTNSPSRKSNDYTYDYVSDWQWRYDRKRFKEELREIGRHKKNGRILDVGAATGNFLQIGKAAGYDIVGVEFSPFASAFARERGFEVHTGALEDVSLPFESFDVVTLHHVLEHVPNPVETLSLVHRLMKPDGLLVVEVPNFASFRSKVNGAEWEDLRPDEHLHQFEPRTLSAIIEKSHFQVLSLRTKSEVLWSLKEPPRLLWIPDRVINRLERNLSLKPKSTPEKEVAKTDKHLSVRKRVLLGLTWLAFFPIIRFYERLRVEKRLVVFAKKHN